MSGEGEWEVWIAGGRRYTSSECRWEDVPDGVLVVRWWGPRDKGINWGDSIYGRPDTFKHAALVSDEEFQRTFEEAQATTVPPSKRGS